MAELRTEMAELRTELKTEMADLRTEVKIGMADLRTEFKFDLQSVLTSQRNLFFQITAMMATLSGLIVLLIRL